MDAKAAVPTFVRTLASMKRTLAGLDIWPVLSRHLREGRPRAAAGPA
jgi:hypothetical protein